MKISKIFKRYLGIVYRRLLSLYTPEIFFKTELADFGTFSMLLPHGLHSFRHWGGSGSKNSEFERYVNFARKAEVVFDIGAHVGLTALPLLGFCKQLHLFEPNRANFNLLRRNVLKNNNDRSAVFFNNVAVGSVETEVPFSSVNITSPVCQISVDDTDYSNLVPQVCLDDYSRQSNVLPDIVKIDVEGWEVEVLKGLVDVAKKKKISVFLSVHPSRLRLYGYEVNDVINCLRDLGIDAEAFQGIDRIKDREYFFEN
jgi:FkbM family methyltransferase